MRIIDADELLNQIEQHCIDDEILCKDDVIEIIEEAPTIEVFAYTKNGEPLTTSKPSKTLIDKVGPIFEQIAETATNFFEDETISGLLEEGEE